LVEQSLILQLLVLGATGSKHKGHWKIMELLLTKMGRDSTAVWVGVLLGFFFRVPSISSRGVPKKKLGVIFFLGNRCTKKDEDSLQLLDFGFTIPELMNRL